MPRNKYDRTYPYASLIQDIVYLKQPCTDVIHDFKIIYPLLSEWFQDYFPPKEELPFAAQYKAIKNIPVTPVNKNRLYVVTQLTYVPLALFNMDEAILRHIQHCMWNRPYLDNNPSYFICDGNCDPSHSISLFIFDGTELTCSDSHIPLLLFIHLLQSFHKENQVDTSGIRQAFYADPRRSPVYNS